MKRLARFVSAALLVTAGLAVTGSFADASSLRISNRFSPLNAKRPIRPETRYIILHTTEGDLAGSLRKVQRYGEAHYLVTPTGDVYRIIDRNRIAPHAGRSMWEGRGPLDNYSIGIEVVGYYNQDITAAQYAALKELLRQLKSVYRIRDENVLTHSMVAYGRPNRFHANNHRGRKRCGMIFARPDVRQRLGLRAAPSRDRDVEAGRLVVADPELHRFLYAGAARPAAPLPTPSADGSPSAQEPGETMVISQGVNAWRIAREKYDDRATVYTFPDGTRLRGNEIRDWDKIPAGTLVEFQEDAGEREQEFEGFLEIGKDGQTVRDLAGNLYNDETTIYFFPNGLVRTGAELSRAASLRRLLNAPPQGTRVLVGYIYGGHIRAGRTASRIAGIRWNYPSTFYRLPNGRILSGDEIDDRSIPARTLIFMLK